MEAEWGEETSESGGPIAPRVADLKGSGLGNGDAILIGDGACQAVQGCLGFVSPRKGCQEPRKTGGMSPWPCLSAGGREECWERRPPVPLTLRSTLCQSTASLLGHTPTTRQTEWHSEQDGENECNLSGWIKLYDMPYMLSNCTAWYFVLGKRLLITFEPPMQTRGKHNALNEKKTNR